MKIELEIRGLAQLRAKLRKLDDPTLTRNVLLRIGQFAQGALQGKPYPPERPGQKYRRTGELNRSWAARIKGMTTISITNKARGASDYYAEYVVGDKPAWMHSGRWWRARDVIEAIMPKAIDESEEYIEAIWNQS